MKNIEKDSDPQEMFVVLKPKEAADLIGCSEYTIKELVRRKQIPHYRIGVRIMFTRTALKKWIASQEKKNYHIL